MLRTYRSEFPKMKEGLQPFPVVSADAECRRLREENARLRQLLAEHNIPIPSIQSTSTRPVKPVLSLGDRKNEPERESHCFGAFFAGERTFTRDDGRARIAGQEI